MSTIAARTAHFIQSASNERDSFGARERSQSRTGGIIDTVVAPLTCRADDSTTMLRARLALRSLPPPCGVAQQKTKPPFFSCPWPRRVVVCICSSPRTQRSRGGCVGYVGTSIPSKRAPQRAPSSIICKWYTRSATSLRPQKRSAKLLVLKWAALQDVKAHSLVLCLLTSSGQGSAEVCLCGLLQTSSPLL